MAIISLSGHKQSGKDTVCKIIQYLATGGVTTYVGNTEEESFLGFLKYHSDCLDEKGNKRLPWQRKLFADKLKNIVCLLIGCTRAQLEDNEFKEKELGEEWDKWTTKFKGKTYHYSSYEECEKVSDSLNLPILVRMTPRLLLQLLGTECGRNIIHPNIWVNSLMSEYDNTVEFKDASSNNWKLKYNKDFDGDTNRWLPNWIITDTRFPNELKAVKDRGGIAIKINRHDLIYTTQDLHESETALDSYQNWNAVIDNDGTIGDLISKVRIALITIHFI